MSDYLKRKIFGLAVVSLVFITTLARFIADPGLHTIVFPPLFFCFVVIFVLEVWLGVQEEREKSRRKRRGL